MSVFAGPKCPRCKGPMPNWLPAAVVTAHTLCQKCFVGTTKKSDDQKPPDRPDRQEQIDRLIDPTCRSLISGYDPRNRTDKTNRTIVALALTFSVQKADKDGVFQNPAGILQEARQAVTGSQVYGYELLYRIRRWFIEQELWIPVGEQGRGMGAGKENKMQLGAKVRQRPMGES